MIQDSELSEQLAQAMQEQAQKFGIGVTRIAENLLLYLNGVTRFVRLQPFGLLPDENVNLRSASLRPTISEIYEGHILVFADSTVIFNPEPSPQRRSELSSFCLELLNQLKLPFAQFNIKQHNLELERYLDSNLLINIGQLAFEAILRSIFPETIFCQTSVPQTIVLSSEFNLPQLCQHFQKSYPDHYFYKPVMIEIELTHKCTLRCPQCSILEDIDRGLHGLEVETVNSFLAEAQKFGIFSYSLTGGEPFLRFDDLCAIIAANPQLDCHKIQTNGAYFSSVPKAKKLLEALIKSGMGQSNQHLSSSIRYSSGIQGYKSELEADLNLINLIEAYDQLKPKQIDLAVACTIIDEPLKQVQALRRKIACAIASSTTLSNIQIHAIEVHDTPANISINNRAQAKLGDLLRDSAPLWDCIDNSRSVTPWPKLLLRANGLVYSCSCFGHVFCLGSLYVKSFSEMIAAANQNSLFALIDQQGILGFLKRAEEIQPSIGEKLLPNTTTRCQICRILRETVEAV